MGSKLQIKSKVGEGSDFFAINFKRGNVKQNIDYTADSIISRRITPLKYFRIKVLIVEDNKINMFLARTLVKKYYQMLLF
jgi:hypothetical protein